MTTRNKVNERYARCLKRFRRICKAPSMRPYASLIVTNHVVRDSEKLNNSKEVGE